MLKLNIDNIGDLAIVECEGRIVQSGAAFKLRHAQPSQCQASTVVVELSEVRALGAPVAYRSYSFWLTAAITIRFNSSIPQQLRKQLKMVARLHNRHSHA